MSKFIDRELEEIERLITCFYQTIARREFLAGCLGGSIETDTGTHRLDVVYLTQTEEILKAKQWPAVARLRIGSRRKFRSESEVRFMLELLPGVLRVQTDVTCKWVNNLPDYYHSGLLQFRYGLVAAVNIRRRKALLRDYMKLLGEVCQ